MTSGRPYGRREAVLQRLVTGLHVAVLRISGGRIGGRMFGSPVLVLKAVGRRSGKDYETPLLYLEDGGDCVIVASNGGAARSPAWYYNVMAGPETEILLGGEARPVRAEEVAGDEKGRLWERLVEMYPPYADYQKKTDREIPVVALKSR